MTQFKLSKKSSNKAQTTFHVTDAAGDTIYGSINVPNGQADDLQKCWRDSAPAASAAAKQSEATAAVRAALLKGPKLSKQGVLRGC